MSSENQSKYKIPRDVLIVDDDKDICEVLKKYCLQMGCFRNIVFANDVSEASQKVRNQKFSLILLDINLPGRPGYDLLKEFNGNSANRREDIVIVSGEIGEGLVKRLIGSGVKSFLVKPFTEGAFQKKILEVLRNQLLMEQSVSSKPRSSFA